MHSKSEDDRVKANVEATLSLKKCTCVYTPVAEAEGDRVVSATELRNSLSGPFQGVKATWRCLLRIALTPR